VTTKQLNNYSENVTFSHFIHFKNGGNHKHPVAWEPNSWCEI